MEPPTRKKGRGTLNLRKIALENCVKDLDMPNHESPVNQMKLLKRMVRRLNPLDGIERRIVRHLSRPHVVLSEVPATVDKERLKLMLIRNRPQTNGERLVMIALGIHDPPDVFIDEDESDDVSASTDVLKE